MAESKLEDMPSDSTSLYKKLNRGSIVPEFRLITLLPSGDRDDIECVLNCHTFYDSPEYEALSYEWGETGRIPQTIVLNGLRTKVTHNLWLALGHLRQTSTPRVLWVDALCIDQNNTVERSHQVSLMAEIYSRAIRVISWLGLEREDIIKKSMVFMLELFRRPQNGTRLLYEDLREQIKIGQERELRPIPYDKILNILKKRYYNDEMVMSEMKMFEYSQMWSDWQDLAGFFSVSYWKRLWIVQEVVLARDLRIQCGKSSIEWFVMSKFLACLRYASDSDYKFPQYILDVSDTPAAKLGYFKLEATRRWPKMERGFSLIESLTSFTHSRCGDPRDKVYGLLGLSGDVDGIYPDYHRTLLELYELMVAMPRFRTDEQLISFSQFIQNLFGGLFHHGRNIPQYLSPGKEVRQLQGMFYTRGTICGTIFVLGDSFTNVNEASDLISQWQSLYFHRVKSHSPLEKLSTAIEDALPHIAKDVKRAVAIDSRLSYAYRGKERTEKPPWDEVILRYTGSEKPEPIENPESTKECSSSSMNLAVRHNQIKSSPTSLDSVKTATDILESSEKYENLAPELCSCLRTSRIPIPPKWMIGSRGQIGLVPGTAKESDIICHFHNSDMAVVVRPFGMGWYHTIVGGAIIIRQWDEEAVKIHERSPKVFNYSVGTKRRDFVADREELDVMSFHFDRTTLRLLTCLPSDLEGFSEVWMTHPAPIKEHFDIGYKMECKRRLNSYGRTVQQKAVEHRREWELRMVERGVGVKSDMEMMVERAVECGLKALVGRVDVNEGFGDGRTVLQLAIERGHKALVKLLVERAVDVNKEFEALVKLLVERAVDVNKEFHDGRTVLQLAVERRHEALVKRLVERAVDVNNKLDDGRTVLQLVFERGHEALVKLLERGKLLAERGVDVNKEFDIGRAVLQLAAERGHEALVKLLVERGVDANKEFDNGRTVLQLAAERRHEALVKLLVEGEVDANKEFNDGTTVLQLAVEGRHKALVKWLAGRAVDVNNKFDDGRTVLQLVFKRHKALVKLLVERGVDVNKEFDDGRTVLQLAVERGHEALVKLLMERGVDVNKEFDDGKTVLQLAVERGHEALVKLLVERGVDVNKEFDDGRTVLQLAVEGGHEALVKLLVERGVDVNKRFNDGRTALHLAAERGHVVVARLLVEKGAEVNKDYYCGNTALHLAAERGYVAVARLLVEKGAEINKKDYYYGKTARELAAERGHVSVVRALQLGRRIR